MSKFYIASTQAKELCIEAKKAKEKNKDLSHEVLLKKREVIRLTEDLHHLQGLKQKLKNEVEELKADFIKKETRITHLEVKVQKSTSSMEKAQKEAVTTFLRSAGIDRHYATGYQNFHANAKEAYPEMDFNSFMIPITAESSLLSMSFEDVNVMDNATTEIALDDPKPGGDAPSGLSQ